MLQILCNKKSLAHFFQLNSLGALGPLSSAEAQRVFSGGEDPPSNVSAGTGLPASAERTCARYHAQDGRHPGEAIFCGLLAGVACVP